MKYLIIGISSTVFFVAFLIAKPYILPYILPKEITLNLSDIDEQKSQPNVSNIAEQLKEAINVIKAKYYSESGEVDYKSIKSSDEFKGYLDLAKQLQNFDLNSLKTPQQKLAFWINIYNSLVVHGIVATGVQQSVWEVKNFFRRVKYLIGGYKFSLDDIEHGILRANRGHSLWSQPFSKGDPRLKLALEVLEPRIHFTLVCGAKSCPPIGVYDEKEIDKQLDLAARSFINSELALNESRKSVVISKIFNWYADDFGKDRKERLSFIIKYLNSKEKMVFIEKNIDRIRISYRQYDWSLNRM